jgi:hypothetical protein
MSKTANAIGVVLACGGRFTAKERERIAAGLGSLLIEEAFGSQGQVAALAARIAKRRFRRVLLAGSPGGAGGAAAVPARQAGLPPPRWRA